MQLTITTDYAIRLVLYLALNKGRIVPATEIAEKMGISKKYLIATAHKVKAARLINGRARGLQSHAKAGRNKRFGYRDGNAGRDRDRPVPGAR